MERTDRPEPDDYQPRLGLWGHTWRNLLCLVISALAWSESFVGQWQDLRTWWWIDLSLGVASFVLVHFRRRWPLTVAVVTALFTTVSMASAGPSTLALVSLATRQRLVPVIAVGLLGTITALVYAETQPRRVDEPFWLDVAFNVVITIAIVSWGMYIGSRRVLLWTLRDRVARAETEQGLRARQAQTQERARIAREMHDVLAHHISQISMHAGALAYRSDLDAETLRAGTADIQAKANQALNELRGVLGVLRDEDGALLDRPLPTYADLPDLVDGARASGMRLVYLDLLEASADVPVEAGRAVYRIVQEGITNAAKHAPGALLTVAISGSEADGISVRLRNPTGFGTSTTPGTGLGLIGLTERAELSGGRLEHRRDGQAFVVEGWIPWRP